MLSAKWCEYEGVEEGGFGEFFIFYLGMVHFACILARD